MGYFIKNGGQHLIFYEDSIRTNEFKLYNREFYSGTSREVLSFLGKSDDHSDNLLNK